METVNSQQLSDGTVKVAIHALFTSYMDESDDYIVGDKDALSVNGAINVVKIEDEYTIAIPCVQIIKVTPQVLFKNIISLFERNLPEVAGFMYTIISHIPVETNMRQYQLHTYSEQFVVEANAVIQLNAEFVDGLDKSDRHSYMVSKDMYQLANRVADALKYINDRADFSGDILNETVAKPDEVDLDRYAKDFLEDYADDKSSGKKKKKKSKKTEHYSTSKVLRSAKSPKKAYKRHGVIVCKDKDAIKRDRRIIKDFLEDFIPGGAKWKKDLRDDLLDRWVNVYAVTAKKMKRLQRQHRQEINRRRRGTNVQNTIDFTRKLFNVPIDSWNDPTR